FFFFFSSRRRHTRFSRDWSSDVCSSDLSAIAKEVQHRRTINERKPHLCFRPPAFYPCLLPRSVNPALQRHRLCRNRRDPSGPARSEERRVGKECRCRREPCKCTKTEEDR